MSWYAIEAIDEAIKNTKELLLPFDLGTWLRLALIVIFTGGGIGFVNPLSFVPSDLGESNYSGTESYNSDISSTTGLENQGQNAVTGMATTSSSLSNILVAVIGLLLISFVAIFFYISSVFEFIYYQSLLDKDVSIRDNFRKHWLKGFQYFVFEIVYFLLAASLLIALFGGFMLNPLVGVFGLLLGIPVFIAFAVFSGLVHDFALLQMINAEEGLISGWRSIWPELRDQWREVAVYIIVKFGIGIALGIGVTTLSLALLIPIVFVFGVLAILFSLVADVLALIPLLVGMMMFGILVLGITVATRTFVYFFIVEVYQSLFS
jgi:hypothetical protein